MPRTPFYTNRKPVVSCLVFAIGLSSIAIYLGSLYSLPIVGSNQYAVLPSHKSVVWYQDSSSMPKFVEQLDLPSGRLSRLPFDSVDESSIVRNSRGQRIVLRKQLEIFDDQSGRLLWSGKMPFEYPKLVGDQYLIEPGIDEFTIIDLNQLIETGSVNLQVTPMSGAVQLRMGSPTLTPVQNFHPIDGTNRFLYHFQDATQANVTVFEVEAGQVRAVTSWPTVSDSQVYQYEGTVLTAAPASAEVEVRSLGDFQLIKKFPLPPGMGVWGNLASNTVLSQSLFSYNEIKTGIARVGHLDNFTLVPDLNLSILATVLKTDPDEKRFVLLGDARFRTARVVVYDTQDRRVVIDRSVPRGCVDQRIAAGHLVFVSELFGLTVDMIDLQTGQLSKRYQPFAWVAWALPVILLLALGWLIVWLRVTEPWPSLAVLNILFIATLFVTPQLAHVAMFGAARVLFRPAMGYGCVTLLALTFCLSLYTVYGRQRILLRTVPVWIGLAVALGLANLHVSETGRMGLAGMRGMVGSAVRSLVIYSFVSIAVLATMRIMGFGIYCKGQPASTEPSRATIPLRDIFVFTACIAAFVAAAAPNRAFLIDPMPFFGTIVGSLLVSAPALLGLISLAPSSSIYQFMRVLALGLALTLIVEITLHISMGHWHVHIWYYLFLFFRYFVFMFLATFVCGSVLRQAGYRWCRVAV